MITIVTDSSAYLKKSEAEELGVKVIPLHYSIDRQNYNESYSDQNGSFEALMRGKSRFATSRPNPAAFLSCFEEEFAKGNDILCITISSRLSGTFGTAYMAAKQTGYDNIAVFDSQLSGGGLYLLIKEAKKLIDSGATTKELINILPSVRDRITIMFSVDDMTPLRKSGRIGFARMSVGTILNHKPILFCRDGAVVADSVASGYVEVIKRFSRKINDNIESIVVSYIGNTRIAANLYTVIERKYPNIPIKFQKMGPVLGIHLGLSVISLSFISKE